MKKINLLFDTSNLLFLGLTDQATEVKYIWGTDYTEAYYTNWYLGQPDNDGLYYD